MATRRARAIVVSALSAFAVLLSPISAAAAPVLPPVPKPPAGANDWNCHPTAQHPRPVVLAHGTGGNTNSFLALSPMLKSEGYCVYALNYGAGKPDRNSTKLAWGFADIRQSAKEFGAFVDRVLAATGAHQVDVVGHSQGGTMARAYLEWYGGADREHPSRNKVKNLVALAPPNHGSDWGGGTAGPEVLAKLGIKNADQMLGVDSRAVSQQLSGSSFMVDLNAGADTVPGVDYTVIATSFDTLVIPFWSSFLQGPNVRNILVQQKCPTATPSHTGLLTDPTSLWLVMTALDPSYATRHGMPCKPMFRR